ncbi:MULTISPECIES: dihydrolipoyl dehydrogenase [Pseudomonas]|uniref:Dihydrolipoyl dehydrogenase n=2 Tax=Pseudomonadaceae TaxID=135621 RepID=A0A0D0JMW8_9PSED|nr:MULTISPECIES: dihydrolipoyl dehydrogenase [Pseudomonas]KIP88021.1 dihydrolipoamide dehydrogenase [Pseudomonas fulva]MCW2293047.1 dihydrolipoamide dehydrogenase [Pseudomonas sp. BIGb0408]NYH72383.1 dihydrolipoamide dehydrogenase [Pseudomonas flavescens]
MPSYFSTQVLVIGAGPGGYSAAFRAADLGLQVTMVERHTNLGGVCLNVGCIPSKALLHAANVLNETTNAQHLGLHFNAPQIDLEQLRGFRDQCIGTLGQGISALAKARDVKVIHGTAQFTGANQVAVKDGATHTIISFEHCIIAAGSRATSLPFLPDDPRIWDSTEALALRSIPGRLLIAGGGIIGLEMATVYRALGSQVTIVEASEQLIPAADGDMVQVYQRYNAERFEIRLNTSITAVAPNTTALEIEFTNTDGACQPERFDALLVAVGRRPNSDRLNTEAAGVVLDERGFIKVDNQLRTSKPHILAIGDINGNPMLAHKASHEGHVAAEVAAGKHSAFAPLTIPSIAYTNPELAWTGLTEKQAAAQGIPFKTAVFPWSASGRALTEGRTEGKTKLLYHAQKGTVLGATIVGAKAGELLGEICLAIEMGAYIEDLALTIHAHPTLHETVGLAAELASGTVTDLLNPTIRKARTPS